MYHCTKKGRRTKVFIALKVENFPSGDYSSPARNMQSSHAEMQNKF